LLAISGGHVNIGTFGGQLSQAASFLGASASGRHASPAAGQKIGRLRFSQPPEYSSLRLFNALRLLHYFSAH
jgi:hypothetical protein